MKQKAADTRSRTKQQEMDIGLITPSKSNLRKTEEDLDDLKKSIVLHGVLQPILVRPSNGKFQIVAGERRFKATKLAGLTKIPVIIRELADKEALEITIIENLQRENLHPMDEAEGFNKLLRMRYNVTKIAQQLGRSVSFIYDRTKFLNLIEPLKKVFLSGEITAGHAIHLARLTPKDQKRIMADPGGGLWQGEKSLWIPGEGRKFDRKAVSVRELVAWITEHVKFNVNEIDMMLFPDTVETLATARLKAEKIVGISLVQNIQRDARDDQKIVVPTSWERADGKQGSKTCDHSIIGVVVIGPGKSTAFRICIKKEKCSTHWRAWQKARLERKKEGTKEGGTADQKWKKEEERRKKERDIQEAIQKHWKKKTPAILKLVAEAVNKESTSSKGFLAELILHHCQPYTTPKKWTDGTYVPRGKSADDFVRLAAFILLAREIDNTWSAPDEFPKRARALHIDARLKKILEEPKPKAEKPKKKK